MILNQESSKFWQLVLGVAGVVLLVSGCQVFEPAKPDLEVFSQQWETLDLRNEKGGDFAKRLQKAGRGQRQFDVSDGVSLQEAEDVALVFHPDLRMARLRAGAAQVSVEQAGRWDDPELSFDVLGVTSGVPDPWIVGSGLSFTLPISGRLGVEKKRAQAEWKAELERVVEKEWEALFALRQSWTRWSAAKLRWKETREVLAALERVVAMTSRLQELGELVRTESSLFDIECETLRVEELRWRGEIEEGKEEVCALMGVAPSADFQLLEVLVTGDEVKSGRPRASQPTLMRLLAEHGVAERELELEIRKQYPDLALGPQAESDEGQSRIGFFGALPLPILNANKGGIAKARGERDIAKAAYETEYQRLTGRLARAQAKKRRAEVQRRQILGTLVPLVDRQIADAKRLVELGEGEVLVLLEAMLKLHEVKMSMVDLTLEQVLAEQEMRFLVGPERDGATNAKSILEE